ncbi:hypothetical protein NU195Hw_g6799t1 [Hortaea werneckii]
MASASACAKCNQPLTVEIEDVDDGQDVAMGSASQPQTYPDDVHLPCNDHLHWECLLDSYEYSTCPACSKSIVSSPPSGSSAGAQQQERIIVNLHNEGGLQEGIDIMPILKEEGYLRAYPEERKSRAFLEFCREGDHRAIAELLLSCNDEADSEEEEDGQDQEGMDTDGDAAGQPKSADEILRYQDPIGEMESGLHAAVANGHREVAWMLLLLASEYTELEFPALVFQEAAVLGVMREDQTGKVDIRSLRDAHGRTAEDLAKEAGTVWTGWIGNGRLAMPSGAGA